jgi:hypothetical protein
LRVAPLACWRESFKGIFRFREYPVPYLPLPPLPRLSDELALPFACAGPSMNAGGAPSDAPAQCSLANVGGLLPCATEDRQVRELQGPPHPAPGLHFDAVVYPPPHYTPVCVGLHSRHIRQHAATVPESRRYTPAERRPNSPNSHPFQLLPNAELAGAHIRPLHGRCGVPPSPILRTVTLQPIPSPTTFNPV